ncbi:MAG: hypothetical protein HYS27_23035 [Deltaproteobacteria bacterium]|nr:hypothetical protein [Deltaproteobacteria bacterium]
MTLSLAVPIHDRQVKAACELHSKLIQWHTTDKALEALKRAFPDWSLSSSLLKIAAINQLYGTNLYAVGRMASHVEQVLGATPPSTRVELAVVDRIAALPKAPEQKRTWTHLSFASKLCHFFIDGERFPIYDSHAVRVLSTHVGKRIGRDAGNRYADFTEPFFHALSTIGCRPRELDRYLWLRGSFEAWRKSPEKAPVNVELKGLFGDQRFETLLRELSS